MGRSQATFSEVELAEINEGLRTIVNRKAHKRVMVLKLKAVNHMKSREIAEIVDMHESTVNSIIRKYKQEGFHSITSNNYKAQNRRHIAQEEEKHILQQVADSITASDDKISVNRILEAFEKRLGYPIGRSTAYKILRRNEWDNILFSVQQRQKTIQGKKSSMK